MLRSDFWSDWEEGGWGPGWTCPRSCQGEATHQRGQPPYPLEANRTTCGCSGRRRYSMILSTKKTLSSICHVFSDFPYLWQQLPCCTHILNTQKKESVPDISHNFLRALLKRIKKKTMHNLHISRSFSERNFSANFCARLSHHISLCLTGKTIKQYFLTHLRSYSFSISKFELWYRICVPSAYNTFLAFNSSIFECNANAGHSLLGLANLM